MGLEISGDAACPGDGAIIHSGGDIVGYICTARRSAALGKSIAMAFVNAPLDRLGTTVNIYQNEGLRAERYRAKVVKMPFYDPEGVKLRN